MLTGSRLKEPNADPKHQRANKFLKGDFHFYEAYSAKEEVDQSSSTQEGTMEHPNARAITED